MKMKILAAAVLPAVSVGAIAQTTYVVPGQVVTPAPAQSQVVIPAAPGGPASTSVAPATPVYVAPAPVVVAPAPVAPSASTGASSAQVITAPVVAAPAPQVVYPTNAVTITGTPTTVTQKPGDGGPGTIDRTHPGMEPGGGNYPSSRDVGTSSSGG